MTPLELYAELLELLVLYSKYKQKKRFRCGNQEIFKSRAHHGFFKADASILKRADPEKFFKTTRMSYRQFQVLVNLLESFLEKRSKRKAIEPGQRLYITIYFLAQGCTLQTISWKFRIGIETARSIIIETCDLLWKKLAGMYVPQPCQADWEEIAANFQESTGLPNCIGALGGKHVRINVPSRCGSRRNRNQTCNSIVFLAACDHNYAFTLVDVAVYDSQRDGGVLRNSGFGRKLLANKLEVPSNKHIPGTTTEFPYYLVAGPTFPLEDNIMKPYDEATEQAQEKYNAAIFRAQTRIETAFDILTAKWGVLKTPINFGPQNARKIVLATIILHNHLRLSAAAEGECSVNEPTFLRSIDSEMLQTLNAAPQSALNFRHILTEYIAGGKY